jgi:hypothetical protein
MSKPETIMIDEVAAPAPTEAVNTNLSEISSKLVDGPEGELARLALCWKG